MAADTAEEAVACTPLAEDFMEGEVVFMEAGTAEDTAAVTGADTQEADIPAAVHTPGRAVVPLALAVRPVGVRGRGKDIPLVKPLLDGISLRPAVAALQGGPEVPARYLGPGDYRWLVGL